MKGIQSYSQYKLGNGLHVALQKTPTKTVAGRLRVFHATLNEKPGEEGLAHFLEHTLFNGGSAKYSPEDVKRIRKSLRHGAFTSPNEMTFPVDMLKEDTATYLDFISDASFHPQFDAAVVEQEREGVKREMAEKRVNEGVRKGSFFSKVLFGPATPDTFTILGDERVIETASIDDLRHFHQRGFHANNMDLILVGGLPDNIEELVEQHFIDKMQGAGHKAELPERKYLERNVVEHVPAPYLLSQSRPEASSALINLQMVGPNIADNKNRYSAQILTAILQSKLFETLRGNGLAYEVQCNLQQASYDTVIGIRSYVNAERVEEAIARIFGNFLEMQRSEFSDDEFSFAQKGILYQEVKLDETNQGRVYLIERDLDYGIGQRDVETRIREATPKQIQEVAQKYLPTSREEGRYVLLIEDPLKSLR